MKINPVELKKIENAYETAMKSVENHVAGRGNRNLPRDRVCLSEESMNYTEMDGMKSAAVQKAEQKTDPEKLRRIKAAIENGTYHVDGADIAAAMLDKF